MKRPVAPSSVRAPAANEWTPLHAAWDDGVEVILLHQEMPHACKASENGVQMTQTTIIAAACAFALLAAGGLVTDVGVWYRALRKPSWQPPDWLFGPAWTLILGLAAWAGVLAWEGAPDKAGRSIVAVLFAANGVLHFAWSLLFFRLRRPDWALAEVVLLWLSIVALVIGLAPFSALASWLLTPYLLWVTFASWLNFTIVRLNGPFGDAARRRDTDDAKPAKASAR